MARMIELRYLICRKMKYITNNTLIAKMNQQIVEQQVFQVYPGNRLFRFILYYAAMIMIKNTVPKSFQQRRKIVKKTKVSEEILKNPLSL